jgi:hypothetical protein
VMFYNDRFSIGSDPPPIPSNAELLYEPPRKLRNEEKGDTQSSTSLSPQVPSTSYNSHPYSVIINPDVDFEEAFLPETPPSVKLSISRSPLPHTPIPQLALGEAMAPDQASTSSSREVTRQVPVLSPDSASSAPSSGCTSPQELEGLLNYYSIPDSPEMLLAGAGFRPMFSPISEELSSQLSPPAPYRSDRRDSQRGLLGTRSQSLRRVLLSCFRFTVILIFLFSSRFYSIADERSTCRFAAPDFISWGRSSVQYRGKFL